VFTIRAHYNGSGIEEIYNVLLYSDARRSFLVWKNCLKYS